MLLPTATRPSGAPPAFMLGKSATPQDDPANREMREGRKGDSDSGTSFPGEMLPSVPLFLVTSHALESLTPVYGLQTEDMRLDKYGK